MTTNESPTRAGDGPAGLWRAFLVCLALIAVFVGIDIAFFAGGESFKREGGGLETVSAVLYALAAIQFLARAPRTRWAELYHVPVLMVLFAFRELDFDKAFTPSGILSLRLYSSGNVMLLTKLIAAPIAAFVIYIILRNAWVGFFAGLRALRAGALWPWFALLAGALVVGTKSIDGLGRKLRDIGIVISGDVDATASLYEEVGEAFIPVCAILAIRACWKGSRP